MFAKCFALMLLVPCAALHLEAKGKPAKPPNLIQNQDTCTLTFAAHSGFGNQLWGALGAGYIAKVTGCTLVMPPVLTHGDTSYGKIQDCKQGIKHEKLVLNQVAPWYKRSTLQWTQVFKLNANIASDQPLTVDPRHLHFLPVHCTLWHEMGEDEAKFAQYLKNFIQKTDPTGSYTIGSGYNTGAPRLELNELFTSLSPNLAQAVSDTQDKIATLGKAEKGDYACVHLRSKDIAMTQKLQDKPLKDWIKTNMADIGSKPLLVVSANLVKNVEDVMEDVCSQKETECLDGDTVMPEANYGFPEGRRIVSNKKLLIELATCAMAQDLYLPSAEKKILIGNVVPAKGAHVVKSTMSELIATMAASEQMQASVKQLVEKKAEEKAETKARSFVVSEGKKKKTKKGKKIQKAKEAILNDQKTEMSEQLMQEIEQVWDYQQSLTEADKIAIMKGMVANDKAFKGPMQPSKLAMVYVAETSAKDKSPQTCKCMAAQLNESPYKISRVQATTPEACYAKKGVKAENQQQRSAKCTHYSALKLAHKNSLTNGNEFSIIFEDETLIKKLGFWHKVDRFLQSPCQEWNYTSVDTKLMNNPWDAAEANGDEIGSQKPENKVRCFWGEEWQEKSSAEAIYPKVRMAEGEVGTMEIVRNSAIPAMLKYLDEEEKRDLPWKSVVNNFGTAVTWLPQMAMHYKFENQIGWDPEHSSAHHAVCSNSLKGTNLPVDASTPKAFEC